MQLTRRVLSNGALWAVLRKFTFAVEREFRLDSTTRSAAACPFKSPADGTISMAFGTESWFSAENPRSVFSCFGHICHDAKRKALLDKQFV